MNRTTFPALALGATMLVGLQAGATAAWAAPLGQVPQQATTSVAQQAPDRTSGSVTVTAVRNNSSGAQPVSGVVFELVPVQGVDLSTPAGRTVLEALVKDASGVSAYGLGTPVRLGATGTDGTTSVADLPLGVYLLRQVAPAEQLYRDMVFALPSLDTRGGAEVMAYELTIYPKPPQATTPPTTQPPTTQPPTTQPPTTQPPAQDDPNKRPPTGTQTGGGMWGVDANMLWLAGGLAAGAGLVGVLGRRSRREGDDEQTTAGA